MLAFENPQNQGLLGARHSIGAQESYLQQVYLTALLRVTNVVFVGTLLLVSALSVVAKKQRNVTLVYEICSIFSRYCNGSFIC